MTTSPPVAGRTSRIWLSDLIHAWQMLSASTPARREEIAALLGFEKQEGVTQTPALSPVEGNIDPLTDPSHPQETVTPNQQGTGTESRSSSRSAEQATPLKITGRHATPVLPNWLKSKGAAPIAPHVDLPRLPYAGLFEPSWTRAILQTALGTWRFDGSPDLPRLIQGLVRMEPPLEVPRLPRLHLRGAQILIDVAEALVPFARDQRELARDIMRLGGNEWIQVLHFVGSPLMGVGAGTIDTWTTYRPPDRGIPVVVLTDLGIGASTNERERASPKEWRRFSQSVTAAGCPLIALVPYPKKDWPELLQDRMVLLPWDRRLTTAQVARARRTARSD